jgi:hypothetical protein
VGFFKRFRASPALLVGSLALLIALGGAAFAAVASTLPRNSVGSPQVINHSRKKVDVAPRQAPRGLRGLRGLAGPAGPAGPGGAAGAAGAAGGAGPIGPTNAYSRFLNGPVAFPTSLTTIANLSIGEAGKYVIFAKVYGSYVSGVGTLVVTCRLVAGDDFDESKLPVGVVTTQNALVLNVVHEYASAGSADVQCKISAGSATANFVKISAIKVANLTNSG